MTELPHHANDCPSTTDGDIAVMNLESARRRAWGRFFQDPLRKGIAETVVEHEQLTVEFVGDLSALDRLESLVNQLVLMDNPASSPTMLIRAQVASMMHRFADARHFLTGAEFSGATPKDVNRLRLNIDQACGANLDKVLDERRETARKSGRAEDLVALGALFADLREFADADRTYRQALQNYQDVSPFPIAWACFQLGVLWGELVAEPQSACATQWYLKAIDCLPSYTKARVHLAEIYASDGRTSDAETILVPAVEGGDPEVRWRLADVMALQGKTSAAEAHMQAARSGFELLLTRHRLAFADHGAEFFAGRGNDCGRALELARVNAANRPTLRAFEQAHTIALCAGDTRTASELLAAAAMRWGGTRAFRLSSLAKYHMETREGAAV
jgi:tetratricopeptide (TPR) repeat protein